MVRIWSWQAGLELGSFDIIGKYYETKLSNSINANDDALRDYGRPRP